MSKNLKPIPENNEIKNDLWDSEKNDSNNMKNILSDLQPRAAILTYDFDDTNLNDGKAAAPETSEDLSESLRNNPSSYSDGEETTRPECLNNIDKYRNALQESIKNYDETPKTLSSNKPVSYHIQKQSPSFLVIESLVWMLCSAMESDRYRRKQMFIELCKSMSSLNVLANSYLEDSLQPIRDTIANRFSYEIRRAQHYLNNGVGFVDNSSSLQSITFDSRQFQLSSHCVMTERPDRFFDDFDEVSQISKGGLLFFIVFFCKTYLFLIFFFCFFIIF